MYYTLINYIVWSYNLDASVYVLVLVVEVKRVLRVVFVFPTSPLVLPDWVVEVCGFVVLVIFLLVVWHV